MFYYYILFQFLSFLNYWESTGCSNMSYDLLINSSNYSIKRYFSSCFYDNYKTEEVYLQPTEFQLRTIEFFLQTNYKKFLNNKRAYIYNYFIVYLFCLQKDLTCMLEDTMKIMSHPLLIVTPLVFEKDMCYYTNKLLQLKSILDNANNDKKIAILSRVYIYMFIYLQNQFTLDIISHFCSYYTRQVCMLSENLSGFERERIIEYCRILNNVILLVDANINLMDCELYNYNYIIVFDNGISLNDHFIYKPIDNNNNNSMNNNNNNIIVYRFITKMTIEEEYYRKVHVDKYNSLFSFLMVNLNQLFIQSLPTSLFPKIQNTNSSDINYYCNLWNMIFKQYIQLSILYYIHLFFIITQRIIQLQK